jgi:hypothetical protein
VGAPWQHKHTWRERIVAYPDAVGVSFICPVCLAEVGVRVYDTAVAE